MRIYPLPRSGRVALMGRQLFPDDILLLHDGRNLLRLNADALPGFEVL